VNAALYVDASTDLYALHGRRDVNTTMSTLSAGFAIGADF